MPLILKRPIFWMKKPELREVTQSVSKEADMDIAAALPGELCPVSSSQSPYLARQASTMRFLRPQPPIVLLIFLFLMLNSAHLYRRNKIRHEFWSEAGYFLLFYLVFKNTCLKHTKNERNNHYVYWLALLRGNIDRQLDSVLKLIKNALTELKN